MVPKVSFVHLFPMLKQFLLNPNLIMTSIQIIYKVQTIKNNKKKYKTPTNTMIKIKLVMMINYSNNTIIVKNTNDITINNDSTN